MTHILRMEAAARHHAATTPGFIPADFVALVRLNGGPVGYTVNMGHNIYTQRGEEAANLFDALFKFSMELCIMGLGEQPYNPFPANVGPPLTPNPEGGADLQEGEVPQGNAPLPQMPAGNPVPNPQPQGQGFIPAPGAPYLHVGPLPHPAGRNVGIVHPVPVPAHEGGLQNIEDQDIIVLD
jgi:hypothetical protein